MREITVANLFAQAELLFVVKIGQPELNALLDQRDFGIVMNGSQPLSMSASIFGISVCKSGLDQRRQIGRPKRHASAFDAACESDKPMTPRPSLHEVTDEEYGR